MIIGPPRSGTTLLCYLLAGDPQTITISEPHLAADALPVWRLHRFHRRLQLAAGLKRLRPPFHPDPPAYGRFLTEVARENGYSQIVIKETWRGGGLSTQWCNRELIDELTIRPTACIIRHPADTVASTLRLARWVTGWTGRLTRIRWPNLPHFRERAAVARWAAANWREFVQWLDQRGRRAHRYEDLVRNPEATLRAICADLDTPYSEQMLQFGRPRAALGGLGDPAVVTVAPSAIHRDALGRRSELTADLAAIVRDTCITAAVSFGYEM